MTKVALAMAGEGSVGETHKEIFKTLGITLQVSYYYKHYHIVLILCIRARTWNEHIKSLCQKFLIARRMSRSLLQIQFGPKSTSWGIYITINGLTWASSSIEQSYKDMTREVFDAEVNELTTPEPINRWAAEKTRNKIQHVIGEISPRANILIANAIYFKVRAADFQDPSSDD